MRSDLSSMNAVIRGLAQNDGRLVRGSHVRFRKPFEGENFEFDSSFCEISDRYPKDLWKILKSRASSLHYGSSGISGEMVARMTQVALSKDENLWKLEGMAGPLEAFIFSFKSTDWPTGIYRVTSSTVTRIGNLEEVGPLENLGIQKEFVSGSGIVSIYASLDRADQWAGAHGYRIACLRASMALYDFHLRGFENGLIGCIFGGFIPSSVRKLTKTDGVTRHPLLAATYGSYPE